MASTPPVPDIAAAFSSGSAATNGAPVSPPCEWPRKAMRAGSSPTAMPDGCAEAGICSAFARRSNWKPSGARLAAHGDQVVGEKLRAHRVGEARQIEAGFGAAQIGGEGKREEVARRSAAAGSKRGCTGAEEVPQATVKRRSGARIRGVSCAPRRAST
jgi:hypothetical protein